ncbi:MULTISPECIES: P-loop NTPase fold protein [unclassified Streptomyces]|uniref:KAP family P-loop NTPase fold protein n=1 Tax=unclassified Streptomyces TaxID=2593676 RepID=UPI002E800E38|nr:P-loop NTPase fold protein [Streptomyces sp. NBC_00589]WTI33537.1 KAP family NTPase [Streptomyces sp. NBC_00775]WTI42390.1 KAP family NTPase [Streptomyces sp. NBC_00775]WUB23928.1 KAP family NTPase [Streptomyces sp. NBC_00589]WUB32791.1 KAP family NTPase [Streptomyces sp. NBC_00589]
MTDNASINVGSLLNGDEPIDDASQDLLQRTDLADAFAAEIRRTSAKHGAVVALTGKWGSGKTSLANLTCSALDTVNDVQVVKFNPWFFSGTDQLIRFFFDELAAQLRDGRRLKDKLKSAGRTVAERLGKYSAALSPLKFVPGASAVLDGAGAVATGTSKLLGEEQGTVHEQRAQLTELLGALPGRIVVFIDDIDRLSQQEIRDLFRLVRLTGSFPNIVYVLCFDREVVEAALTDEAVRGATYLEKIVKMSMEVPPLPSQALSPVIAKGLTEALDGIESGPFHAARWPDVLVQVILPMFSTIRDVKRYLASVPLTVRSLGLEVNLVDVLALEALRVRYPAAHAMLHTATDLLTPAKTMYRPGTDRPTREKAFVEEFTGLLNGHAQPVIRLLFPAADRIFGGQNYGSDWIPTWERDRRVACSTVLDFYLHRQLPAGRAPAAFTDQVVACIGNESMLDEALGQVPDALLDDTLKRLVPHCRDVPEETVLPTAAALVRQLPRIRLGSSGMYSLGGEWAVLSPVSVLLRNLSSDVADHTVRSLFHGIPSLYGKVLLLDIAAGRPDKQGLIPEESARLLKRELLSQLHAARPENLADERMLLRTVLVATADTDGSPVLEPVFDARVVARLLESGVAPVHSQTMGSVAVRTEQRLVWDSLVSVYGGEVYLAEAVALLHQSLQEGTVELNEDLAAALALYEKYATGWRPE